MDIAIDPNSPVPLYQQIRDSIVAGIADGELSEGDALVSVRQLAGAFSINPATVVKAYDLLRAEGFVRTEARSGTVVAAASNDLTVWREKLRSVLTEGRARGLSEAKIQREVESLMPPSAAKAR